MPLVGVRAKVESSDKWKEEFKTHGELFKSQGVSIAYMGATDNNSVLAIFETDDLADFGKKISYYISNKDETRRIAKNGWVRGHKFYNEKIVTNYFLEIAFKNKPESDYGWPIHQYFK